MSLMLAEKGSVTLEYMDVPHKGHATSLAQADDAEAAVTPIHQQHETKLKMIKNSTIQIIEIFAYAPICTGCEFGCKNPKMHRNLRPSELRLMVSMQLSTQPSTWLHE